MAPHFMAALRTLRPLKTLRPLIFYGPSFYEAILRPLKTLRPLIF